MPYEIPSMAGTPYRPSNGTEGEIFQATYCDNCVHDDPPTEKYCQILTDSLGFQEEDPRYPEEWTHNTRGEPTCTEFDRKE